MDDFDNKIDCVYKKLAYNGDYTKYHKNHILAVCYEVFFNATVRWQNNYNSYPIPQFDIKNGYNNIKINEDLIKWRNGSFFYNIKKDVFYDAMKEAIF